MAEFPMTQQGYDEAVKKLEYLQKIKRAEIVQRIAEARSHGDLSENAEYDAARNEQAANERAIEELDFQIKKRWVQWGLVPKFLLIIFLWEKELLTILQKNTSLI